MLLASIVLFFIQGSVWCGQAAGALTEFPPERLAGRKIIVSGDLDYKPYTFLDTNGVAQGLDVDLMRAIARQANLDVEYKLSSWTEALAELEAGKVDVLLGIFHTEARSAVFDFTVAHTVEFHAVFAPQDSPLNSLEDIRHSFLVMVKGDASWERLVKPMGLTTNITFRTAHSGSRCPSITE